jgi:ferric-dicitrate binding protein FerR (iron transport regulator)
MNRTLTAAHSQVRFNRPAFTTHESAVASASALNDEVETTKQVSTVRFRGAGLEADAAPVSHSPVFTPRREHVRMHRETMVALSGGIMAALLIICSFWLMITYSKSGAAAPGNQREQRLFDQDPKTKMPR